MISVAISDAYAERFGVNPELQYSASLNDSESSIAFMISQLAHVEAKLYETPYADIVFEQLVPISTDVPEWADTVNYRSYDGVTMGKFIGASADDLPTVAMSAQIHTVQLGYSGLLCEYSLDELRKSVALNMPIDQTQMKLAFRGAREHQQKVVLFGDEFRGMFGLLNHPNVTKTNSTVDWNTAEADAILADVNKLLGNIWKDSNQRYMPDTLLLDTARFLKISTTRLNTVTSETILEYLLKKNVCTLQSGKPFKVFPLPQLLASNMEAGMGEKKDRMVAYERTPENLTAWMPIAPRFIAPQYHNLKVMTPMEYKISGTEFRYPMCAAYCTFDTAMN